MVSLDSLNPLGYVDGLITYLVQIALTIVYAIFYPVVKIFSILTGIITYIWTSFANFLNSFLSIFNTFYTFSYGLLTSIFPIQWVILICFGLLIMFAFLLYSYLRDIEILGNKI